MPLCECVCLKLPIASEVTSFESEASLSMVTSHLKTWVSFFEWLTETLISEVSATTSQPTSAGPVHAAESNPALGLSLFFVQVTVSSDEGLGLIFVTFSTTRLPDHEAGELSSQVTAFLVPVPLLKLFPTVVSSAVTLFQLQSNKKYEK